MDNEEYIRKAVELADNWVSDFKFADNERGYMTPLGEAFHWKFLPAMYLDALAAQLVRQVDATGTWQVNVNRNRVDVEQKLYTSAKYVTPTTIKGQDRTMNTIRAIVDSKILE